MIVTTFYDVEGDYAMPGQSAASIETVERILEIERRYGIRSTYNIVARYALDAPDLIAKIHKAGNEIASHSYDHTILTTLSASQISDQLQRTRSVFQQLGFALSGHRSPQSEWNNKVLNSLLSAGYKWSAENGSEPYPYQIRNLRGNALWRFPILDDDWCYESERLTPASALSRWQRRIVEARARQQYAAIGFHPWVEAAPDRLSALDEFFHWLSEQKDIQLLPFGEVLHMINQRTESKLAANER